MICFRCLTDTARDYKKALSGTSVTVNIAEIAKQAPTAVVVVDGESLCEDHLTNHKLLEYLINL